MSRRARVTFEYQATENDELDLAVGQIIEDITDEDEGWCKGFLDGKTGLFPNNFVEFITASEAPTHSKPPPKDSLAGKKARVAFDYDAANEDELSLKSGEVIEIICEVEDGWWEGKFHGKTGVFPSNFVELVKENEPPPLPPPKEEAKEPGLDEEEGNKRASIIGQAKKMGGGMGFGNIINAGVLSGTRLKKVDTKPKKEPEPELPIKPQQDLGSSLGSSLKKVSSGSSIKRKAPPAPPPAAPPTSAPAAVKKVERAKVLFDYEKQNDDELDLVVGDIVTVLNKEIEDTEGWWEGELKGKTGLFPDNFVELLPEEEEEKPKHVNRKISPVSAPGFEKSAPPPVPDQDQGTTEPHKKDMKKASDHEPPKLPPPKQKPKTNSDFPKPGLPLKKPVPPKPSTKPMIPSKKPVPKPPPTEPKKDIPPKASVREQNLLRSSLKDDKLSDAQTTSEEYSLDVVTPHEPLKQLTANRAGKQQSKRPPSTTRQSEGNLMDTLVDIVVDEEEKEKPAEVEPKEPAWKREATKAREEREAKKLTGHVAPPVKEKRVPPPVLSKPDEIIEKRKSWLNNDIKKTESAPSEEVSGLRKEVTDLRALVTNMERKMAAMELKHEEQIKSLEKRLVKDIEQLTSDFDEERTNHARLKIEVDRLKKKLRRTSDSIDDDSSHA